jgi:hypothetical protein
MRSATKLIESSLPMRPPEQVMNLSRLGSLHQSRISFMRTLMRKIMREKWVIEPTVFELDEHGYGTVVYTVQAKHNTYSFVLFSNYLNDDERNDRVIAEKWDLTMTLCIGEVNDEQVAKMKENVPKQEAGRANSNMIVLSRGNKSSRNFEYVVNTLAEGHQPLMSKLTQCGYLYRTTAVYGSGKFGMADWAKVKSQCPDFARPFSAEMFSCYMLRHFSVEQAVSLAKIKSPKTAVPMEDKVRRYIGIGNSTGLGMAPYLIRHPKLLSQWMLTRETAVSRVVHLGEVNKDTIGKLENIINKVLQHISETNVPDAIQTKRNENLTSELTQVQKWLLDNALACSDWRSLVEYVETNYSMETQEILNSLLMEIYPSLVDELEEQLCVDERYEIQPNMSLSELKQVIESRYDWALNIDFSQQGAEYFFWYRSEEKMEPRLGQRFIEPGEAKEMPLTVARLVRQCYDRLCVDIEQHSGNDLVAYFLIRESDMNGIVKRIQTMSKDYYGEIQGNLADENMLPLDLLRCKLSFFGVSKFDPKSKLWVRNSMFQGAPILSDIGKPFDDDWYFPIAVNKMP